MPNIRKEIGKAIPPSIANFDPPTAVPLIRSIALIVASCLHVAPNNVLRTFSHAVHPATIRKLLAAKASTRSRMTGTKVSGCDPDGTPTIAYAHPNGALARSRPYSLYDEKPLEFLATERN